jgi:hypothetical protein
MCGWLSEEVSMAISMALRGAWKEEDLETTLASDMNLTNQ